MYNSATFLKNEIVSMREAFTEIDIKQSQAILSLRMMLEEKDSQHFLAVEGIHLPVLCYCSLCVYAYVLRNP